MQSQEHDTIAAFLQAAVSAGASSQEVAALVGRAFEGIDHALAPIIGQRGVAALRRRSLHLVRPMHPWLPTMADDSDAGVITAALTAALAARTSAEAAATGTQLLEGLRALLATLIGDSLTERLLRPVWATFLSGPSARETTS